MSTLARLTLALAVTTPVMPALAHHESRHHGHVAEAVTAITTTVLGGGLGAGAHEYESVAGWCRLDDDQPLGNTHGAIVIDRAGRVYFNTDTRRSIMVYTPDGRPMRALAPAFPGIHGMVIRVEDGEEFLYAAHLQGKQVLKMRLDGTVVWTLGVPMESGKYDDNPAAFSPTGVAVAPNGDVYVADGYGRNWIHQFARNREYVRSFGGPGQEPGRFRTCHGIALDERGEKPVLLVCDRENRRLQRFDLDGTFIDVAATDLRRPCAVAFHGDDVAVAELEGRVTILDEWFRVVTHLGDNPDRSQWANNGVKPAVWQNGVFTAPHSCQFDEAGNLYVMDWNAAGRISKLRRLGGARRSDAGRWDARVGDFTPLFNGRDLTGWWGRTTKDPRNLGALAAHELAAMKRASLEDIHRHWRAEDGVLVNDGHGLFLTTERDYGDFELRLEYRTVAGADSGVYLRGIPQVQIWDTTEAGGKWAIGADGGSGGLWNNPADAPGKIPLVRADRPFGEWNAFRITMVGERVTVFLNDELVVDHARLHDYFDRARPVPRPLPRVGPIQLQTHGGEIRWRNLFIREIGPNEANAILARHDASGFDPVFNGRDLEGWRGATDGYEVVDGAVRCRPGHGGTLYTAGTYDDFVARLEFRLPPGGNNGLAIRYPGHGDPAYAGMCELQVLDNTHEKFATLDDRQYHGSIYAQAPAHRGYLRRPGEWNFQEITVRGSRIKVELNGTVILDRDLAEVTDLMYDRARFQGRTNEQGHFGFAGHNDPVAFRNVLIRPIE